MKTKRRCYADILGNCDSKMSREHYISQSVFDLMSGDSFTVSGFHWQKGDSAQRLRKSDIAARVLCRKHNSELSSIDSGAQRFLKTIYDCTRGGIQGSIDVSQLSLDFDGRDLERWLLKVACGAIASGNHGGKDRTVPPEFVEILFGQRSWPEYFCLYSSEKTEYTVPGRDHMQFDFRRDKSNRYLQGVTCYFMSIDLTLVLGNYIGVPGVKRPKTLVYCHEDRQIEINLKWNQNFDR